MKRVVVMRLYFLLEPVCDLAFQTNFSNFEIKNGQFDEVNRDSSKRIAHFLAKIWKIVVEMEIVDRFLEHCKKKSAKYAGSMILREMICRCEKEYLPSDAVP